MGAAIASRMRGPPNLLRKSAPPRPAGAAATRSLTRSPGAHVPVLPHNFVQTTGEAYASRSVSNTQIHQRNRRSGKAGGSQHRGIYHRHGWTRDDDAPGEDRRAAKAARPRMEERWV